MTDLSTTDHRLIAALKKDGRASITTLAGLLNVSRATVQSRMERLVSTGVIQRFTVELDAVGSLDLVRAVMMIELQGALARAVIRQLRNVPEIISLHTTNGTWDLVARIEVANLVEFDRILRNVREISGVLNSETCILLDTAKAPANML
jgi:DNA-binding Lrp family transcriptional regulator